MTRKEKRIYLIKSLLRERPAYIDIKIPTDEQEEKNLLRSLLNIRMPQPVDSEFFNVQDSYLREEIERRGITEFDKLTPIQQEIYLWKGDITTLKCDAIVNAANSSMLGCFFPCHGCIDNAIHTFAGVQLRLECAEIMNKQGKEEKIGGAKITLSYNLPCKYVIHTVGPTVSGSPTKYDELLLASCYRSCLELAEQYNIRSIAFCCISTGEFHFPNREAAKIAIRTVKDYKKQNHRDIEVIFNVFKESDYQIYRNLLGTD